MNSGFFSKLRRRLKGQMLRRVHYMITCREFEDFVLRYLDDELTKRQRSMFELHIRFCRECREYLEAYKRTLEISKTEMSQPETHVPEDVPEDLIKAILEARKQ